MDGTFTAYGIIDKNSLAETKLYLVSPAFFLFPLFGAFFLFVMFVIEFSNSKFSYIYLFSAIFCIILCLRQPSRYVVQKLDDLDVIYNTRSLLYFIEFNKEHVHISYDQHVHISYDQLIQKSIPYTHFYKVAETRNYYIMFYREHMPLIIVKDTLSVSPLLWKEFIAKKMHQYKEVW